MSFLGDLPLQSIRTRDRAGTEHKFFVRFEDHGFAEPNDFVAYTSCGSSWPPADGKWYEMSFKQQPDGELQTVNMANHDHAELSKKGIGPEVLLLVCRFLRRDIVSSPTYENNAQRRSPSATRVWESLVSRGFADREGDRFRLHFERVCATPDS